MTRKPDDASLLKRYAQLETRLEILGGYNRDYEINRVCNGLEIPQEMRSQKFSLLSGGEKTCLNLCAPHSRADPDVLRSTSRPTTSTWIGGLARQLSGELPRHGHDHFA